MRVAMLGCECFMEDKKSESKKGHNSTKKKIHFELSPLILLISLWIVNTKFDFQVNKVSLVTIEILQNVTVFIHQRQ